MAMAMGLKGKTTTKSLLEASCMCPNLLCNMHVLMFLCFSLMNLNGDLEDLEPALGANASSWRRVMGSGSCSSLIKVLPGMSDLLVSHDMWGSYHAMLRIFKLYNFSLHQHKHGTHRLNNKSLCLPQLERA